MSCTGEFVLLEGDVEGEYAVSSMVFKGGLCCLLVSDTVMSLL